MIPKDFINRMQDMLGSEFSAFMSCYDRNQYKSLRFNPLKASDTATLGLPSDKYSAIFNNLELSENVPWEKTAYYSSLEKPGKHPYHEAGVYYIQEPSAMAPVSFLDVKPGERILDLCAAPGGKTTQIAGKMQGQGLLICNEPYTQRAKILSENIERMGVRNAIVTNEYPEKLSEIFSDYFHKILVDAPCSGEGMIRKNEDATEEWSLENVKMCADRQLNILDNAALMLRPGGRLVYSTCTFAPEEDEGLIERFLELHPEFHTVSPDGGSHFEGFRRELGASDSNIQSASIKEYGFEITEPIKAVRIWPHKVKGEGHFLAILEKEGSVPDEFVGIVRGGFQKSLSDREVKEFKEFARTSLVDGSPESQLATLMSTGIYVKFGDQLYLLPAMSPNLKGLKVLRPGLHLGTFLKNRFEPAHALAMSMSISEAKSYVILDSARREITDYINGQVLYTNEIPVYDFCSDKHVEIDVNSEKPSSSWVLVTVDGFSIGWAKYVSNMLKNHYPKGLRKFL